MMIFKSLLFTKLTVWFEKLRCQLEYLVNISGFHIKLTFKRNFFHTSSNYIHTSVYTFWSFKLLERTKNISTNLSQSSVIFYEIISIQRNNKIIDRKRFSGEDKNLEVEVRDMLNKHVEQWPHKIRSRHATLFKFNIYA